MEKPLKDKHKDVLRFINDYIERKGFAPKREEIAEALGISLSAVHYRIHYLFDYGYLIEADVCEWGRSIEMTKKGTLTCQTDK